MPFGSTTFQALASEPFRPHALALLRKSQLIRIGHEPAATTLLESQSVEFRMPLLFSLPKNVRPGWALVKLPPLLSAAAQTAPVAAPAWPGTPFRATELAGALSSCDQVVGQLLTICESQPNETIPP